MKLKRQYFRPGRRIEQIGKLAEQPFFTRRGKESVPTAPTRRFLPALAENIGALFSIAISLVLLIAIVALVYAFAKEIRREAIYLDPIDVPEDLTKRGFTPAVVTDRLLDRVRTIQSSASTTKPRQGVDTNAAQVDIQVPVGAISMKALVRYARSMLDLPEQHLSGEITRDGETFNLLLRSRDRHNVTVIAGDISANSVDALVDRGGEAVVRATDPYVLASYWFDREQPGRKFDRTLAAIQYVLAHARASDDAWALNLWGLVLENQGDKAGATTQYRRAIATDPSIGAAYSNLFSILAETGQPDEVRKLIEHALAQPRPTPTLLHAVGNAYSLLGEFENAEKIYQRLSALDPGDANARAEIVGVYYQLRRYDDAERAIRDALAHNPRFDVHLVAEGIELERGHVEQARTEAAAVRASAPRPTFGDIADAYILLYEGRYAEAAALFQRASAGGEQNNPYVFYGLGRALAGQGQLDAALDNYQRALTLQPAMAEALTDRSMALAALGRNDEALKSFAAAEKAQPRYARLYYGWSQVLEKAGRKDEAAAKLARANALAREQRVVWWPDDRLPPSKP